MKRYIALLLILAFCNSYAQHDDLSPVPLGMRNTLPLTEMDAAIFNSIEEIVVAEEYLTRKIPDSIDNSKYIWHRPVFSQEGMSCMQSSTIAYAFTYEVDRLRNLSADTSDNQYPSHFAWNFFNGGNGWYGVNYLFTMDVLQHHGTPNITEYGGLAYGNGERWMSGYDEWHSAMNNRIVKIYKITVNNEFGLAVLKHWLTNHLDSSETGGLANFIACSPWTIDHLPEGYPNAGKSVVTHWCPDAVHGMTIVGYNDSIRFDYNNDGQFSNHIDINQDGEVNMKDWEIGALKFVNSYGDYWADDGYCYMMYKTLADDISEGGIWMNTVHIMQVKESHNTPLTCKVSFEHEYRERIRIRTGISTNMQSSSPDYIHDYTIFNYQGAWHYMQGIDSLPEYKTIEFGLDISPLLSHVEPGQACRIFLIVDEKDPNNYSYGQVNSFSLIDYNGTSPIEIFCEDQNVPLINDGRTLLSIVYTPEFDDVVVTTDELPVNEAGQAVEIQMEASGGEVPYIWHLDKNYDVNINNAEFPTTNENLIIENSNDDSTAVQALAFNFPFYGKEYDTVVISASGYIAFDENMYFWPYLVDQKFFLKNSRVIAPFLCDDMMTYGLYDHGVWYEGDVNSATFRWKTALQSDLENSLLNFAVRLYANGNIDFYYGDFEFYDEIRWKAGIADGDMVNYSIPELPLLENILPGTRIQMIANPLPDSVSISSGGLLRIVENDEAINKDISVAVVDNRLLKDTKTFQLTDGLEFNVEVSGSSTATITNGHFNDLDLYVKNRTANTMQSLVFEIDCGCSVLEISDDSEEIASLQPGESITIPSAFSVRTNVYVDDRQKLVLLMNASYADKAIDRNFVLTTSSASIDMSTFEVLNENGILSPGETADLRIKLVNNGSMKSINTQAILIPDDPGIMVNSGQPLAIGTIYQGEQLDVDFNITADYSFDYGEEVNFVIRFVDEIGMLKEDNFNLRIGKVPVCIVDLDPGMSSGPQIFGILQGMEVEAKYTASFPYSFDVYQSVILCLGSVFQHHEMNYQQSQVLSDYLNQGGKLYMEGPMVWKQDPLPGVINKFNVESVSIPGLYEYLDGVDGTFTEGLVYEYDVPQPYSFVYLEPVSPAFSIFMGREPYPYCAAVAHDAGTYKTIGTIFELGKLLPSDTCQIETLMEEILEFFEVVKNSYDIKEMHNDIVLGTINSYPNPFSYQIKISFELNKKRIVKSAVYDLQGRKICDLGPSSSMAEGQHSLSWDGKNADGNPVPAGIYIYRILVDGTPYSGKMILIR